MDNEANKRDPYAILQVDRKAEPEIIDAAWRKLAQKYHPDRNTAPDANRRMQDINWAYSVLRDPVQRGEYDRQACSSETVTDTSPASTEDPTATNPDEDPMDAVRRRINSLQSTMNSLVNDVHFSEVATAAANVTDTVGRVNELAKRARGLGYLWEKDLELRCFSYQQQWQELEPQVMVAIEQESTGLASRVQTVIDQANSAILRVTSPANVDEELGESERAVSWLVLRVFFTSRKLKGMFAELSATLDKEAEHLNEVHQMLELASQSKIEWLPREAVVAAVKAKWDRDGKIKPRGYLFLTNQRVLFERNEQEVTKKVLFVPVEWRRVQQVIFDSKLSEMKGAEASKRGLFGHEDHLHFNFDAQGQENQAHFHIDGQDANYWQSVVSQAKSGELESTRVEATVEAENVQHETYAT